MSQVFSAAAVLQAIITKVRDWKWTLLQIFVVGPFMAVVLIALLVSYALPNSTGIAQIPLSLLTELEAGFRQDVAGPGTFAIERCADPKPALDAVAKADGGPPSSLVCESVVTEAVPLSELADAVIGAVLAGYVFAIFAGLLVWGAYRVFLATMRPLMPWNISRLGSR